MENSHREKLWTRSTTDYTTNKITTHMLQFCTFIRYNFILVQLAEVIQGITQESVICMFRVVSATQHNYFYCFKTEPHQALNGIATISRDHCSTQFDKRFTTRTTSIMKLSYRYSYSKKWILVSPHSPNNSLVTMECACSGRGWRQRLMVTGGTAEKQPRTVGNVWSIGLTGGRRVESSSP